jgi:hypothetical protein
LRRSSRRSKMKKTIKQWLSYGNVMNGVYMLNQRVRVFPLPESNSEEDGL